MGRLHGTLGVALAALLVPAIAVAQEKTLIINSFGGSYEEHHRRLVIEPFEKEFGVRVEVVTAYSGDTLAQLRAQKENPQFDVVHLSGGLETIAATDGLLAPIKPEELSNYGDMYPFAVAGIEDGIGPMYSTAAIGLLYNTEMVKTPPTSWKDLMQPELGSHLLVTDAASNTYGMLAMLMMNQVNGGDLGDVTPGLDFVKQLLDNGATVVSKSPEIQQNFAQGTAWIAAYAQDYAFTLTSAGLPVKFVQPSEGAAFAPITVNLVAGRPNRDLAVKFIDFSIRAEASAGWAEALRYSPTNRTVELSDELAAEVIYGEEAVAKLVGFDPVQIGESRGEWNEAWKRALTK